MATKTKIKVSKGKAKIVEEKREPLPRYTWRVFRDTDYFDIQATRVYVEEGGCLTFHDQEEGGFGQVMVLALPVGGWTRVDKVDTDAPPATEAS